MNSGSQVSSMDSKSTARHSPLPNKNNFKQTLLTQQKQFGHFDDVKEYLIWKS